MPVPLRAHFCDIELDNISRITYDLAYNQSILRGASKISVPEMASNVKSHVN